MHTRNVLMFGGRSVGKSSVLAAIYDQAGNLLNSAGLEWVAEQTAFNSLREKKNYLKDAFKQNEEDIPFLLPRKGDTKTSRYAFEFGKKAANPEVNLVFIDTAGEMFEKNNSLEFDSLFKESRVAILVVDAIELIKGDEKLSDGTYMSESDKHNAPVMEHIKKWVRHEPDQPRLLCIVLAKTELWLRERQQHNVDADLNILHEKLHKKYEDVFSYFKNDDKLKSTVAIAICPVQTCGNIIFDKYVKEDGAWKESVKVIKGKQTPYQPSLGYAPLDCDQPLRYILAFYLKMHLQSKRIEIQKEIPWWVPKFLVSILPTIYLHFVDIELINAINLFSKGIKEKRPFDIIQGEHLIK